MEILAWGFFKVVLTSEHPIGGVEICYYMSVWSPGKCSGGANVERQYKGGEVYETENIPC